VLGVTFNLFFKAERNWNWELKRSGRLVLHANISGKRNKAQFLQSSIQRSSLQATNNKQLGSFYKIFLCLFQRFPLGSNVERGTMGYKPASLLPNATKKPKLSLNGHSHIFSSHLGFPVVYRHILTRSTTNCSKDHKSKTGRSAGRQRNILTKVL